MSTATSHDTADESLVELVHDLQERVEDLEAENDRLQERVDELETELEDTRSHAARERAEICGRVHDLEEATTEPDSPAANPTPDAEKPGSTDLSEPESPLEQIVALPEHMADDQLSANQRRARFVAADVRDYAESVPAGWTIPSSDLRRILRAAGESAHTQTVQRVMEILADLSDDVRIVERRGTKRVVFDDALVERLARLSQPDHDVVMTAEG